MTRCHDLRTISRAAPGTALALAGSVMLKPLLATSRLCMCMAAKGRSLSRHC